MSSGNAVLSETGPLSLSVPLTLIYFSGAEVETRGTFARLSQSPGELRGAFGEDGPLAYTPVPSDPDQVEFVRLTEDGRVATYRVLDRESVGGALASAASLACTRFQLVQATYESDPVELLVDFDPLDFDPLDFG